jgi:hypothetical protein
LIRPRCSRWRHGPLSGRWVMMKRCFDRCSACSTNKRPGGFPLATSDGGRSGSRVGWRFSHQTSSRFMQRGRRPLHFVVQRTMLPATTGRAMRSSRRSNLLRSAAATHVRSCSPSSVLSRATNHPEACGGAVRSNRSSTHLPSIYQNAQKRHGTARACGWRSTAFSRVLFRRRRLHVRIVRAEDRQRAFDRFWRARSGHGSGLGPSIVRRLVQADGGRSNSQHEWVGSKRLCDFAGPSPTYGDSCGRLASVAVKSQQPAGHPELRRRAGD